MPFTKFLSKMVWPQRTRKRKCAGNHISDMNESTAFPQFISIGTLAKLMAKRSVLSSMIVRDLFWLVENLLQQLANKASN
jgi:hypothetical protein